MNRLSDLIKTASEQAREIILNALGRLVASGELPTEPMPNFIVEIPADKSHGDMASNAAMASAKAFKMPPRAYRKGSCDRRHLLRENGDSRSRLYQLLPGRQVVR